MEEIMIHISKLNKSYGSKRVLKDIDLNVKKGECLGIVGKNGTGKTTLLECIENIRKWESGTVSIQGVNNLGKYKEVLGVQLQSSSLPADIKVIEAMDLFAVEHGVTYSKEDYEKFGIQFFLKKKYKQLSTGQKRRLHLFIAILHDPQIVILDEPTAGLDIEGKEQLYAVIDELKAKGKTILITSHDMTEVEKLCDRVAFVIDGRIVRIDEMSTPENEGKEFVICIKTQKGIGNYIEGISSATYHGKTKEYEEYHCISIASFLNEFLLLVLQNDDEIEDLYVRKSSIEKELADLIKGA
ncbi:ATP-binding cassette domain-containing protein [Blautia liquoris]|uniref:ATP-binding cassette domain-containing protein n=1 Tax=Blautia liquoris TaxID=2779518 RepID=A0A7M2RFU8_9FIRM|nr:ATP-binding cassette domain-containing protein [Blautia liquoris]QOV19223.1 ATP-binding cassette domain-containing protein [Blautia liquoris]